MPRAPRIDIPGMVYHVICRGIERRDIFKDAADYDRFLSRIPIFADGENITIYAFALMPNHLHMLVRPLAMSLAAFMRRLLTSYAMYFNRRHNRSGHLFQNRYKSFVVEEDRYFIELIRYIHLNPLRVGILDSVETLCAWPYTGHAALMGNAKDSFLAADEVLFYFGRNRSTARKRLDEFMRDGLSMGRQADFAGGGLKRSMSQGLQRSSGSQQLAFDERILGSSEFVEVLLSTLGKQERTRAPETSLEQILDAVAQHYGLSVKELCSGARRRIILKARASAVWLAAQHVSIQASGLATILNVSPTAVCRILKEGRGKTEAMIIALDGDKFSK